MTRPYRAVYLPVGRRATLRRVPTVITTLLVGLVGGFAVCVAANFCTTIYLHRALSHRAAHRWTSRWHSTFRVLIWVMTGIRPRQWVAVHRKHHAFTDEEGDPHSPKLLGWVNVQIMNVALYRKEAAQPDHDQLATPRTCRPTGGTACCSTTPCSGLSHRCRPARRRSGRGSD